VTLAAVIRDLHRRYPFLREDILPPEGRAHQPTAFCTPGVGAVQVWVYAPKSPRKGGLTEDKPPKGGIEPAVKNIHKTYVIQHGDVLLLPI